MLLNKLVSITFRLIYLLLIVVNYVYFILLTWLPICKTNSYGWIVVFLYHLLAIMLLWTLAVTARSDPGPVPFYWGFHFGDSDLKRRKYCLMCNVFKPERCHHCSVCNRCVLNMDHHCPWINNCIGFYNRKYFIQMLFYLNLTLVFIVISNSLLTFEIVQRIFTRHVSIREDLTSQLLRIFLYSADCVLLVVLVLFFKFHLLLIFQNKTTIETIDNKNIPYQSQVMGTSKLLWFLPLKLYLGYPKGNGIDWIETAQTEEKKVADAVKNNMNSENSKMTPSENIKSNSYNSKLIPNISLSSLYVDNRGADHATAQTMGKISDSQSGFKNSTPFGLGERNKHSVETDNQTSSRIEMVDTSRNPNNQHVS